MATTTAHSPPAHHPGSSADRARYRDVLGAAEFRAIFAANIVSMLGSVVAAVALTVLVYQQTRSPALASSVMALSFLPYLIGDRKSTRLNSSHVEISYAVFCLKKKKKEKKVTRTSTEC